MEQTAQLHQEHFLDPEALIDLQARRLDALLAYVRAGNTFYQPRLAHLPPSHPEHHTDPHPGRRLRATLDAIAFTTRADIEADQRAHPPYGSNFARQVPHYTRCHQTSGSAGGTPVRWLDSPRNWHWWTDCWKHILHAAGVRPGHRVLFAFSFGPFIGFWSAFSGAEALGCLCLPTGGQSSEARLRMIADHAADVLCCMPTYALRLAETAAAQGVDLTASGVRRIIVAGEPGGSIPAVRSRIEAAFNARAFDHWGMTEIGPLGFECLPST